MAKANLFAPVRNEKVPQRIIGQIRSAILEGKLKPGDKLPSEQELTAHFGVSRQTLREALRALEILGLLGIKAGSNGGAFVCEVDLETTKDSLANFLYFKNLSINHISEIRKVLEPFSARLAVARMSADDLVQMRAIQAQCRSALEKRHFENLTRLGISFHRTLASTTKNPILILILDCIENLLTDVKKILQPDIGFSERFVECHELILRALEDRDPDRAEQEMYHDVSVVEEELMRLAKNQSEIKWT